tara:strand:- start:8357 stop:9286 length:930 start_codon:yes stop_codon:yes gene_type:complete
MATRNPLIYSSGDLIEMTSAQVDAVVDNIVYQYSLSPSVTLSVVGSSGSLGAISDTRLQAGAISNSSSSFPGSGTTQDPQTVTTNYDKVSQAVASVSPTTDTGTTWPVYYTSGGEVHAMPLADIKDTFLHPAIDLLTASTTTTQQGGTYFISSSASVSGATEVSGANTPIFVDTRANTGAYAAGSIGDHSQDNPTTITSYYLQRVNGATSSYENLLNIDGTNHLQQTGSSFDTLCQEWIRATASASTDGYTIRYNFNGSGTTRGSGMANTILDGSNYQTRQVGDDYRAQEFPAGSVTTAATHTLKIVKA